MKKITPLIILFAATVWAQQPLKHTYTGYFVDSGYVANSTESTTATYSETIQIEGASWLRLYFNGTELGSVDGIDDSTLIRITSSADGAVQELDARSLAQWRNSSAFFNGDEVLVELIADPGAMSSRLRITEIMVGEPDSKPNKSICGPIDDRELSSDPKTARIVPVGCTAWLIDDAESCFLTAGHCIGSSFDVIEFNVPLSDANGVVNHPPPEDQYLIDQSSIQWDQTAIGNDWAYFGGFRNPVTELTPFEAQGERFILESPPQNVGGETIRVTGYGTVDGTQGNPRSWSQVQTTHSGPLTSVAGTRLEYQVDTTGGDSGSAVLNEDTGGAIGIHTNAGCDVSSGSNSATSLANSLLLNALVNPVGVCVEGSSPLRVRLVEAIPDPVSPSGTSFEVDIVDAFDAPAAITSATLVYDAGAGDQTSALEAIGGARYRATLPAIECGAEVAFRIDVVAANGITVRHPYAAQQSADRRYHRWVANEFDGTFRDNFDNDLAWTVDDDASLSAGSWERGGPIGFGLRADPPWDGDTSGSCFLTENLNGNTDVDDGATRLISPTLDATGPDPHIAYWRWWSDEGGTASDDTFEVEVSDDDGASWTTLESVGPNVVGSWVYQSFRIADFVTPNAQFRIRFVAQDLGSGGIVEAGVDGVALLNTASGLSCETSIFTDGFESGDLTNWSISVP